MLDYLTSEDAKKWVSKIEQPFSNLPHLPKGLVKFIASIAPWLVAIGGIMSALGAISSLRYAFGMGPRGAWWADIVTISPAYHIIEAVVQAVIAYLSYLAFKPLQNKEFAGWMYLFWMSIVSLVSTAAGLIFIGGSVIWSLIGVIIGWYVLFELKPSYAGTEATTSTARKKKPKTESKKTKKAKTKTSK